jgi:glycosyltransferase involved in cell wall biosynthesis
MKTLLYIGNKLSEHGYTPTSIETLGLFFEGEGYKMHYASSKENQVLRFMDMGWSVIKLRSKVDYVIIDTYSTSGFWFAFMVSQLCRLLSKKYIPILRGGNLPYRLDKSPRLCNMIFNHSYRNVAPSAYLMDAFKKHNYPNLLYIPNTIQLDNYPFTPQRQTNIPKMLWVRSFAHLYNPKMAVDVLQELKKEYPEVELCMVGPDKDGSLEETRRYASSLNLEITFTGRLSKDEWIALSKNHNIFINTTNFDNTPVSVIEAICLGIPVVTTNVGGIPFLLEDKKTALLVEKKDIIQMSDAVKSIIENSELRTQLIKNGRSYIVQFDWNEVKKIWFEIL